ncbi:MAG: hypothetical protein OHK0046_36840 [Anaerolineae bacterium]
MGQRKKSAACTTQNQSAANDHDLTTRLHHSLQHNYTPLPASGEELTEEQLAAVFGGDLNALVDLTRLIQHHRQNNSRSGDGHHE